MNWHSLKPKKIRGENFLGSQRMIDWHSLRKEDVVKALNSDVKGLTEQEAELRLEKYGKNELREVYKINPLKIFFKQFNSFLIYILLAAIIVSLIIQHYIDASVIFAIVILNASLGFIQQYRAEQSILKLRKLFVPKAKVFRAGKLQIISSKDIVPGDIILYEEGDKIIADSRIIEAENLEVNEAILTGESAPIEKLDVIIKQDGLISERINMLFAGTTIVKGKVKAIITETGMRTEFGKIALKLQEIKLPETPMQKKLDKFAKQITVIVLIFAALIFILGLAKGADKIQMLLTSIALIVSAIPEGLPAIITISLAFATKNMLKNNVLIRRLPAAETLGSVTVICSDKTGTMTEEKMSVTDMYCNNKFFRNTKRGTFLANKLVNLQKEKELFELVKTSVLSSNARFEETDDNQYQIIGDPTESAFVSLALDLGIDKRLLAELEPRIKEISFSSERKMMSILRKSIRRNVLYSKGSPSTILEKSAFEFKKDGIYSLSQRRKQELKKIAENFERKGLRVLAFAYKYASSDKNLEQGLIFLGFIGMLDPPRPEIKEAIRLCKLAGIKIKMITGDSLLTANTIAKETGIEGKVVGGKELEEMSDEELNAEIENIAVFARINPSQKLRIVEILMQKNEQVAITGDGVNDILALKRADIGIAMGKRGSDVARDVSDMVLLDDNFYSIVKGIEQGRIVYDNSKKATKFLLASNFGETLIVFYSIIFNLPLPILPLQILWINLVTDAIPALALIKESGDDVMKSKPRQETSILKGIFLFVLIAGLISLIASIIIFYSFYSDIEKARTMVMFSLIGFEVFFVFSCRSEKTLKEIGLFSNKYIWYAILSIVILQIIIIYTPLASVFSVTSLSLREWVYVLLASLPGLVVFEAIKIFKNRKK